MEIVYILIPSLLSGERAGPRAEGGKEQCTTRGWATLLSRRAGEHSTMAGAGPEGVGPEGWGQLKEPPLGNEPPAPNNSTAKDEALNKEGSTKSRTDIVNELKVE